VRPVGFEEIVLGYLGNPGNREPVDAGELERIAS
jgi:hypothetical protein